MLEKFKLQMVSNSYQIFGGADTSNILIVEEDIIVSTSDSDNFIIVDDIDGA